jgi:hypothetical protein
MDAINPLDSQSLLDQGEQLLDSSRQLLAHIDDALGRDPSPEGNAEPDPGPDGVIDLSN